MNSSMHQRIARHRMGQPASVAGYRALTGSDLTGYSRLPTPALRPQAALSPRAPQCALPSEGVARGMGKIRKEETRTRRSPETTEQVSCVKWNAPGTRRFAVCELALSPPPAPRHDGTARQCPSRTASRPAAPTGHCSEQRDAQLVCNLIATNPLSRAQFTPTIEQSAVFSPPPNKPQAPPGRPGAARGINCSHN